MSPISRIAGAGVVSLVCAFCCLASGVNGPCGEKDDRSAADLIAFLTYQSDRPDKITTLAGMGSCGPGWADRAAGRALVMLGASAIPQIEAALDSIEQRGQASEFSFHAQWLLYTYAGINGRQAYPRLRRMAARPGLGLDEVGLDNAIAVSLGLTSYVSPSQPLVRRILCRAEEPRDALSALILGWEKNDLVQVRTSLGPSARASLESLLRGRTWRSVRSELWPDELGQGDAVGYRFETSCRRADPEYKLTPPDCFDPPPSATVDLPTVFKDATGADCVRQTVRFVDTTGGTTAPEYRVDSPDVRGLLRAITSCAVQTLKKH